MISNGIALYNWYAVDTGKLAPKGWHVPTDEEITLSMDLYYKSLNLTYNGYRLDDGRFIGKSSHGYWWSSTESEYDASRAYGRSIFYSHSGLGRYDYDKKNGFSVRLLRD